MASLIKQIRDNVPADGVSKRRKDGVIVIRRGFYYRNGQTAESYADRVRVRLTEHNIAAKVINCGEVWKPFRGGASLASQSHFWVEVIPSAK